MNLRGVLFLPSLFAVGKSNRFPSRCSSAPPSVGLIRRSRIESSSDLQLEFNASPKLDECRVNPNLSPTRRGIDTARHATSEPLSPILSAAADKRNAGLPPRKPYHLVDTIHVDFRSPKSPSVGSSMASPILNCRNQVGSTDPDLHSDLEKTAWRDAFNEKRDELQQALKEVEWARKQAESIVHEKVVAASLVRAVPK